MLFYLLLLASHGGRALAKSGIASSPPLAVSSAARLRVDVDWCSRHPGDAIAHVSAGDLVEVVLGVVHYGDMIATRKGAPPPSLLALLTALGNFTSYAWSDVVFSAHDVQGREVLDAIVSFEGTAAEYVEWQKQQGTLVAT